MQTWVAGRAEADPGTVLEVTPDGLLVSALGGSVLLKDVQLENRRRMSASEFAKGYRGIVGEKVDLTGLSGHFFVDRSRFCLYYQEDILRCGILFAS